MQLKTDTPAGAAILAAQPSAQTDRVALGMAASALSVLALSTMNMFAKLVSSQHSVIEVAFYRNVIAVLPFLIIIFVFGRRDILIIKSRPRALVARSLIGTFSLMTTFSAFIYLPMADAQALFFTSSLFIPVLGYFFLKERVGPYRWSAVLVGFVGMLIMVRPTGAVNATGITLALSAACMHAMLGTLLRLLRDERPETTAFYFLLIGTGLTSLAMPFVARMPEQRELLFFLGAGISGALAQFLLSMAYKYAPAALVTMFNYTGIIWATTYGWFIWKDWPGSHVWTGAAIIIGASVFIAWREQRIAQKSRAELERTEILLRS